MRTLTFGVGALVVLGVGVFAITAQEARAGSLSDYLTLDPSNSNDFATMADLLLGDPLGVIVGDKVFSDFSYSTLGDDMPDAQDVNVFGFQDSDGNYGLSFHGAFIDLPGGGTSSAALGFTVEVDPTAQQQGWKISDAHLFAGGMGVGDDSSLFIDESFAENNQTLSVFASTLGQDGQQLSDWVDFDQPYTSLRVTKNIIASAGPNTFLPARVSVIDQSFSQARANPAPEPTSLVLMTLAGLGLAALVRRGRRGVGFSGVR